MQRRLHLTRAFCILTALTLLLAQPLSAALDAAQQDAVKKLTAKGGAVTSLAANDDSLVVNLALAGKNATDAELEIVKTLPKVVQLNLGGTAVTDAGLAHVAGLSSLTHLHLEKTAVTDAGLQHLKGLSKLWYLNLYSTAVTDAGLEHVKGLKELRRLYLWQTKVTEAGANAVKQAIPEIYVNRGVETPVIAKAPETPTPAADAAKKPINTVCPVSGKPVDVTKTLTFEGKIIGFCCENCPKAFEKEPAKFKDKIKADAVVAAAPAPEKPADKKPEEKAKPINTTCPVSGKPVDAQFTLVHEGKTIGFCCNNCPEAFKKDPAKFAAKIKADAVAAAPTPAPAPAKPAEKKPEKPAEKAPETPLVKAGPGIAANKTCPVSGKPVNNQFTLNFEGKTVGFCCENCPNAFQKDPAKFRDKIKADATAAAAPAPAKPAEAVAAKPAEKPVEKPKPVNASCPISGKPVDATRTVTFEGKLLGFCCENCQAAYEKDPAKYKAKATAALAAPAPAEKKEETKEEKKPAAPAPAQPVAATVKPATPAPAAKPINAKCPVSGEDIDTTITFSHDGKLVAFCCEDCRDKFKAEPAKFVAKLSANAPAPQPKVEAPAPKPAPAATPKPVVAAAEPAKDGNLLKPTDKVDSWRFEQHETGKGTIESKEGAIVFTVTEAGGADWHVQAFQTPLDLKDGKQYTLTFKAKAADPRAAKLQAQIDEEDWHTIGLEENIDLTKDWKDFSYTFTASDTRPNKNRLGFVLGDAKGTVHVKDLKLVAK